VLLSEENCEGKRKFYGEVEEKKGSFTKQGNSFELVLLFNISWES